MKKLMLIVALGAITSAYTATKDAVDLTALLEAKYERDMSNETGRVWWHGRRVMRTADPSNEVAVSVYADGHRYSEMVKKVTPKESVEAANAALKKTIAVKGVPKALAEARKRRAAEQGAVSNVTVKVVAGGVK